MTVAPLPVRPAVQTSSGCFHAYNFCTGLIMLMVCMLPVAAQDMPTPEEMQEMQTEMQDAMRMMEEAMGELDPETRKQVEQMMANPPASPVAADNVPPVRNEASLASVETSALGGDELKAYLEGLQPKIDAAVSAAARARAEAIYTELGKSGDLLPRLRAAANGLSAWGAWPEATWLMGKLALASGSAQDLNNLAALLSMQDAGLAALPVLYTLNARYPNNSTLMNNLGQARYGLGDSAGAEQLLIAAVAVSPLHPQANLTLGMIQAARGDQQAAQASLHKALQGGYSNSKEELLRKAGGKLNADDVRWRRPMPQDPLGLESFVIPAWPMKAAELPSATVVWRAFHAMANDLVTGLGQQQQRMSDGMDAGDAMQAAIAAVRAPYLLRASRLMEDLTAQYEIAYQRQMTALAEVTQAHAQASLELDKKIEAIDEAGEEQYRNVAGGYAYEYTCGEVNSLIDAHLTNFNRSYAEIQNDMLASQRRYLNELAFLSQYTSPSPRLFEITKLSVKTTFAQALRNLRVALFDGMEARAVCFAIPEPPKGGGKLAKFEDIHCEYISTLNMPGVGSIVSRCNMTEANFDPIFAPFSTSWTSEIADDNTNHLRRASAQISIEGISVGGHSEFDADGIRSGGLTVGASTDLGPKLQGGPLEIGVEVGITAGIEFDRGGITDVSISAGMESKTSSTIGDTGAAKSQSAMTADVNSTWSWNAGFSGDAGAGFDSSVF